MLSKRSIIVGLVGLNLFLLAAVILSSYELPTAYAQKMGAGGNFIAVTCEVDESYDVFYIVDLSNRRMHAIVPSRTPSGSPQVGATRDLERDFRRGQ